MNITQAIILAAGLGTRMGEASAKTPKALFPLAGRPLIDHVIAALRDAGIDKIVVTAHAHADQLIEHLRKNAPDILISDERDQLMNTGGGVARAFSLLRDAPFITHNCDSIFPDKMSKMSKKLASNFDPQTMDALLLLKADLSRKGDFFLNKDGRAEQSQTDKEGDYIYTGAQVFSPALMRNPPDGAFIMDVFWQRAQSAQRLFGRILTETWLHVGTARELKEAENFISSRPKTTMLRSDP